MASGSPTPIKRRAVAKGIAWSVPAVAVAGAAPAFAVSGPPPSAFFYWGSGCVTVNDQSQGCAGLSDTPQIPFSIRNDSGRTLQFQILGTKTWNGAEDEPPASFTAPEAVYTDRGEQVECFPVFNETGCDGFVSVTLQTGGREDLWLVGNGLDLSQSLPDFWMSVQYRWIQADPCGAVVGDVMIATSDMIEINACTDF